MADKSLRYAADHEVAAVAGAATGVTAERIGHYGITLLEAAGHAVMGAGGALCLIKVADMLLKAGDKLSPPTSVDVKSFLTRTSGSAQELLEVTRQMGAFQNSHSPYEQSISSADLDVDRMGPMLDVAKARTVTLLTVGDTSVGERAGQSLKALFDAITNGQSNDLESAIHDFAPHIERVARSIERVRGSSDFVTIITKVLHDTIRL